MRWVGVTLGAVFLAWIVQSVVFSALLNHAYRSMGSTGIRLLHVVLWSSLFGGAVGWAQAGALRRSLENVRVRWLEATIGGSFLGGLLDLLVPEGVLQDQSLANALTWTCVYGIISGSTLGLCQGFALRPLGPAVGIVRWIFVSIGAITLGNVAGTLVSQGLTRGGETMMRMYYVAGVANSLTHALVTAFPMGLVLGARLFRSFGTPDEAPAE
jgi:hypothetical protein